MKKQCKVISLFLIMTLVLTGCSWADVKSKFFGSDTQSDAGAASGAAMAPLDYDPAECVTLATYKGVEVDCKVTKEELQEEIDSLVEQNSTMREIKKGTCKKGDTVNIDYVGKVDGKKFDNGSAEDQTIELGNSGYIDGFDDGIIGMKVGEKKDVKVTFPSDYSLNTSLAGKDAVFTIKVNYIGEELKAKYNDKLIKAATEYKTVEKYEKETKKSLAKTKEDNAGSTVLQQVLADSTFNTVPQGLTDRYTKQADAYYRNAAVTMYGAESFEAFLTQAQMTQEQYEEEIAKEAEEKAKLHLLVEAIAAAEKMSVGDDEVKSTLETALSSSGYEEDAYREEYKSYYGDAFSLEEYLKFNLLAQKVVDFMAENAKIIK